ncbi:hypothetical protein A6M27_10755 [Acidithiobacillus thiooxidans]|uniref:Uncharacterized protein n=1 Tax=Acidithiobacillus thiooxidans TaxID=930 RepID=A0A1C2ILH1_ACITH|nr:hypothetical protein [Acidithiobacillus thiooxidans]OCX68705.1 hypothetical protein A6O24_19450 [Acidithiobacillus thiooxidans]OCX71829.1 hypothetical protein A6P07_11210 [Acidithiobacillus thiooxidans]OCX76811.1 hypothetical protein A6O26_20730 [Acidithiobacillus thiooxidans]OCX87155.1 hypothetical protein A6M27_10755 [Acidithiobacillus thiooxidans]OFC49620.1 hypothetical protein BAE47_04665 [Acidithiobacillus thiooxidans]
MNDSDDILTNMESMVNKTTDDDKSNDGANSKGESPTVKDFIHDLTPVFDDEKMEPQFRLSAHPAEPAPEVKALKTGFEMVADLLPMHEHKALGQWVIRYKLHEDDPIWGGYIAGAVSFKSAEAAHRSAALVINGLEKLPQIVQNAFFNAEKEVRADLANVFATSGGKFIISVQSIISKAADNGAKKLEQAATVLDKELTRKIELRKDEGVELWVQKAMEAADLAVSKHKKLNFYFNTMGGVSIFILGSIFGVVLALHI